jgi:hypothetical protein
VVWGVAKRTKKKRERDQSALSLAPSQPEAKERQERERIRGAIGGKHDRDQGYEFEWFSLFLEEN